MEEKVMNDCRKCVYAKMVAFYETCDDYVKVVRCKNCKAKYEYSSNNFYCYLNGMPINEDDFCSLGEKMDGEEV